MALVKCPNCGAAISSAADVCPKCGSTGVRSKLCYECKTNIPANADACPNCGHPQDTVFVSVQLPPFIGESKKWKIITGPIFKPTVLATGLGDMTAEFKLDEPAKVRFSAGQLSDCTAVAVPGRRYEVKCTGYGELTAVWAFEELD